MALMDGCGDRDRERKREGAGGERLRGEMKGKEKIRRVEWEIGCLLVGNMKLYYNSNYSFVLKNNSNYSSK